MKVFQKDAVLKDVIVNDHSKGTKENFLLALFDKGREGSITCLFYPNYQSYSCLLQW